MTDPTDMTDLAQAMVAAMAATPRPGGTPLLTRGELRQILEAAAPHIAATERARICRIAASYLVGNVLREFAAEVGCD
jgi:hypothetical protein